MSKAGIVYRALKLLKVRNNLISSGLPLPQKLTYRSIATNVGVLTDGLLPQKADELKTKVLMALLQ